MEMICCREEVKKKVDGRRTASKENEFDQELIQACSYKDAL